MSEEDKQAVVDEADVSATQDTGATSAREEDDLDKILAEFNEQTRPAEPSKPEPTAGATNDQTNAAAEVLAARDEIRSERFQRDMGATIKDVRGDLPTDLYDDDFMTSWIDAQAKKDPRLAQAWVNRNSNPQSFAKVKAGLGREFAKRYGKLPDKAVTEDREIVTAAVRGASTKAPEGKAPDYAKMSNSELDSEWQKFG